MASRPRIAVLLEALTSPYHHGILRGISERGMNLGYDIVGFSGCALDHPNPRLAPRNNLFKLINPAEYQGIIIPASTLSQFCGLERFGQFAARYDAVPIVSIGAQLQAHHGNVCVDNWTGIQTMVRHLVEVHGRQKIAIISGPEASPTYKQRIQAIIEALSSLQINFNHELLVHTDPDSVGGILGIAELLDQRHAQFDAIMTLNDGLALRAIESLLERGIRIPEDVIITGFDGRVEGAVSKPSLSSINARILDQGRSAMQVLHDMLQGGKPRSIIVETTPVYRQSCGCSPIVDEASIFTAMKEGSTTMDAYRKHLVFSIDTNTSEKKTLPFLPVYQSFRDLNTNLIPPEFLDFVQNNLGYEEADNAFKLLAAWLSYNSKIDNANNHLILGKIMSVMHQLGMNLGSGYSLKMALETISSYLGISKAALILFDKPESMAETDLRLVAASRKGLHPAIPPEGIVYPRTNLLPELLIADSEPFTLVIMPLVFGVRSFGIGVFDATFSEGMFYELLQNLLSSALESQEKETIIESVSQRFTDIALSSADWMFETDHDLILTYASEGAGKILGITPDLIAGKPLATFLTVGVKRKKLAVMGHFTAQETITDLECDLKPHGSNHVYVTVSARPVFDSLKRFKGYRGVIRDISERKSNELAQERLNSKLERMVKKRTQELESSMSSLQRAQEKLIETEKMAAMGGLVAGISHEINTPIGVSVTAASLLKDKSQDLMKLYHSNNLTKQTMESFLTLTQESTKLLLNNLDRANQLIKSFKQIAVDNSINDKRTFELGTYLQEIIQSMGPELRRHRHTVNLNCPEPVSITSSPGTFIQIFSNLVMNSIVHGFSKKTGGLITIDLTKKFEHIELLYQDNGVGMSAETINRIYEPFFTTARGTGGSGLGMNIVYNLVTQKLGGTIQCESSPGQGTRFTIQFKP